MSMRDKVLDWRDRVKQQPLVERAMSIRVDAPRRITTYLLIGVLLVVGLWGYGWWMQIQRDQVWRERIAASSSAVREAMKAGNADVERVDAEILKILGDQDAKLKDAERQLDSIGSGPVVDGCPRLPRRCWSIGVRE